MYRGYIYKITSPTGRVYIGQTNNVKVRKASYKAMDCKGQKILYKSIKKHTFAKHIFEVIQEITTSKENLNIMEIYWIGFYKSRCCDNPLGMNITAGGEGSLGLCHSDKTKKLLSRKLKGKPSGMKGKKHTEESKDLIRKCNTGDKSPVARLILNFETGVFFSTITEAAIAYNIKRGTLGCYVNGNMSNKTSLKYA